MHLFEGCSCSSSGSARSPLTLVRKRGSSGTAPVNGRMTRRQGSPAGLCMGLALTVAQLSGCGGSGGSTSPPPDNPAPAAVAGLRCSGTNNTGWCWQSPQPWSPVIEDVEFTDDRNGWAVGDALLRTTDGGNTWAERTLPGAAPLRAIRFADATDGWLLGRRNGLLWRTRDGGQSWTAAAPAPLDRATGMALLGKESLLVNGLKDGQGGAPFTLLSDDAAASWRTSVRFVYPEFAEPAGTLWGLDAGSFAASTDGGRSFSAPAAWDSPYWQPVVTGDGNVTAWQSVFDPASGTYDTRALLRQGAGGTWLPVVLPPLAGTQPLFGLALFADGGWARALGGNAPSGSTLWHRDADAGAWSATVPTSDSAVFNHGFVDGRTAWVQREGQAPAISTDGGLNWRGDASPSADAADALQFLRRDGSGALLAGYGGDSYLNGADRWYRSSDDGRTWRALPGTGSTGDHITAMSWIDGNRGLAATSGGRWLDTTNGGHDWVLRTDAGRLPGALQDLQFTADGTGWVVGRLPQAAPGLGAPQPPPAGPVYRSLDHGRTWTAITLPMAAAGRVTSLQFVDNRNGFLMAFTRCQSISKRTCYQQMFATRDAGASWQAAGAEWADGGLLSMQSALGGVRLGPPSAFANRQVFTTADGGWTWSAGVALPGTESFVPRRLFAQKDRLWLLGENVAAGQGSLLSSIDGGLHWTAQALSIPSEVQLAGLASEPVLNDIAFADDRNGWIVGRQGLVLATTDGGASWVRQASGSRQSLHMIRATGAQTAWIGGTAMSILATASGGR
jgi:photosystem II stability/assembly factor-like uncharacterized protein